MGNQRGPGTRAKPSLDSLEEPPPALTEAVPVIKRTGQKGHAQLPTPVRKSMLATVIPSSNAVASPRGSG